MIKFSINKKLDAVLNGIYNDILENVSIEDLRRYGSDYKNEPDLNIAQHGNLLVYYNDIYNFYRNAGYKSTDKMSAEAIWNTYKRQVGFVARYIIRNN